MKKTLLIAALAVSIDAPAHAMIAGMPGHRSEVDLEIMISMQETDDGGMVFAPSGLLVEMGSTVRFLIENKSELTHEFILDMPDIIAIHKEIMASRTETHSAPNAVTLEPGQNGEIIWKFSDRGSVEFACLIPGHYESGMSGKITVK